MAKSIFDVREILEINGWDTKCPECGSQRSDKGAPAMAQHMIMEHGYMLLHVGLQTLDGFADGQKIHDTVYVVGK